MPGVDSNHLKRVANILEGFNQMIEKKAIVIDGHTVHLFPELWQRNPKAFMTNTYRYFRIKHKKPEGTVIHFKDLESGKNIGIFQNSNATIL